eukprot:366548-Chlamydomonas_euryale.AAC.10
MRSHGCNEATSNQTRQNCMCWRVEVWVVTKGWVDGGTNTNVGSQGRSGETQGWGREEGTEGNQVHLGRGGKGSGRDLQHT